MHRLVQGHSTKQLFEVQKKTLIFSQIIWRGWTEEPTDMQLFLGYHILPHHLGCSSLNCEGQIWYSFVYLPSLVIITCIEMQICL